MPLKTVVDRLEDVAEPFRAEYEAKDGKFVLKLDGVPSGFVPAAHLADANGKLTEFRDNNRSMHTELETLRPVKTELESLKTRFAGIDPVEVAGLKTKITELEKNGVTKPDDVTTRVSEAVKLALAEHDKAAVAPLRQQIADLGTSLQKAQATAADKDTQLVRKDFESSLTQIGLKAGVDEKMLPHFVRHGLETFKFENGRFVAKNGDTPLFSTERPTDPLTPEEWVSKQAADSPGFFKPSGGGGATTTVPGQAKPVVSGFKTPDGREVKTGGITVLNQ